MKTHAKLIFFAVLGYTSAYKIAIVLPLCIVFILLSDFKNLVTSFFCENNKRKSEIKTKLTKG